MTALDDAPIPCIRYASDPAKRSAMRDEVQHLLRDMLAFESPRELHHQTYDCDTHLLGSMALVVRNHTPHSLIRGRHEIRSSQLDHYGLLLATTTGGVDVDSDGRRVRVQAGQPVLVDMARVGCGHFGTGSSITLYLPRDALDAMLPRRFDLHGVTPTGAGGRVLAAYLQSLVAVLPDLRQRDAAHAMTAALNLMAASLAPSFDGLGLARESVEHTLLRRAQRFVEDNIANPDLNAADLCAALNVSRSVIYKVFEPHQGIRAYISERRLARCHGAIAEAKGKVYMTQLADRFGIRSAAQFSRAFRRHYGYSPSEVHGHAMTSGALAGRSQAGASIWLEQTRHWALDRD